MRSVSVALFVVLTLVLAGGCALRPRYAEVVPAEAVDGDVAWFVLLDRDSGEPLTDVPVIVGEGRQRVRQRTDANGVFTLPVRTAWQRQNPIIEVVPPSGVRGYDIRPTEGPSEQAPSEPAAELPEAAPPAAPAEPVAEPPAEPSTETPAEDAPAEEMPADAGTPDAETSASDGGTAPATP